MTTPDIQDEILVMQTRVNVERDGLEKQKLQKQLQCLRFRLEIDQIRKKIEQLS